MIRSIVLGAVVLIASGCAMQRPVLYPNEQFMRVGTAVAERDTSECMHAAEAYISTNGKLGDTVQGAATGAAASATIGAAAGAAGGAVIGRAGTAAAIGAAGGGAAGATRGILTALSGKRNPSPIYKNFVNRCLRERGYDPIGWQ